MSEYWFELRHAARGLLRTPWFTLTAVLMLGVGLGLVMYMFGAIQSFMLRPLPFAESERLIHIEQASAKRQDDSVEVPLHDYLAFRDAQTSVESLAGFYPGTVNLSGDLRPERYDGAFVSADTFEVLGVKPILGRGFQAGDDKPGVAPVVVLGHALWQNRFQGDAGVVGRAVRVNGRDAVVVGVMPEGFAFPVKEQIWLSLDTDTSKIKRGEASSLELFGRLKPGVSIQQAQAEFDGLVKQQVAAFPETSVGDSAMVKPYRDEFIGRNTKRMLFTMLSAVALVLGIACANVANLMLARAAARSRECAIRSALGASRRRIIAQTLLESMLVALAGGAIGLWLAYLGGAATMHALATSEDPPPYWFLDYRIDAVSVAVTFGIALLAAAVAGLIPALRASSSNPALTMREGGAGQIGAMGRLARFLVSAEIAACMMLLFTAGLNVRAVMAMSDLDRGFDPQGMLTGRIGLFQSAYPAESDVVAFQERLEQRLAGIPGATAASVASSLPMTFSSNDYVRTEGQVVNDSGDLPVMAQVSVGNRYFETVGIPVLEGRAFDAHDLPGSNPVIVVSQGMATKLFPGQSALGKRVGLGRAGTEPKWYTVVGVARDVVQNSDAVTRSAYYLPFAQNPTRFMSLIVRTPGDTASLAAPFRAAVESLDPDLPIYWLRSMPEWLKVAEFDHRLTATLFGLFGAFAVLLASAGIYAVLAYAVSRRTREIGVMRALGARDSGVLKAVFGQSVRQLALGLGVGVVLAFGFAQLIARMLEGVSSYDPLTFLAVATLLTVVTLVAALVPTRRALRIEPMTALRYE